MKTVKEIARQLNLSIGKIYSDIRSDVLECHRFGTAIRITEQQLADYIEKTHAATDHETMELSTLSHLDL